MRRPASPLLALGLLALAAAPAAAQTYSAGARAAGLADAFGAVARGATAALFNPANLGQPDNPRFSLLVAGANASVGSGPITLGDLDAYGGRLVPDSVKQRWLGQIPAGGRQTGGASVDAGALAVGFGPLALTFGAVGEARVDLPREAVEVLLFGNGGAAGVPSDITIPDGAGDGFGVSFVGLSFGLPLYRDGTGAGQRTFSIGATGKYLAAGALAQLWDAGGTLTADPVTADLRYPAFVAFDEDAPFASRGFGADLGAAWSTPRYALGLTVSDVFNTFEWDRATVDVYDGRAFLSTDSTGGSFDAVPLDDPSLPAALRDTVVARLDAARFRPAFRLSSMASPSANLLLSLDLLLRSGSERALQGAVRTRVSGGVEWRPVPALPLRAGGLVEDGGGGWTLGTGLDLGPVSLAAAYGRRYGDRRDERLAVSLEIVTGR